MTHRKKYVVVVLTFVLSTWGVAWAQDDGSGSPIELWNSERPWESIDLVIALDTSDSMKSPRQ